jgi:tetratricopeptide (TPR) repeat protein
MKPPLATSLYDKKSFLRHRFQYRQSKSVGTNLRVTTSLCRYVLWVASSVSLLTAPAYASPVLSTASTDFSRAIAIQFPQSPLHKAQLSGRTLNVEPFFLSQQTLINLSPDSSNILQQPSFVPERIAASVESASALNNRGIALMNQGDYAAAQTVFNQALKVNPRFAPAYSNRAMIHILMGEEAAAVQDYTTALSLNPSDGDVYFNRGLAYAALENDGAAIADYTTALRINPRNAQAYHARGGVHLSLNNRAMARSDFQNAVVLYRQQGYQEEYSGLQEFLNQL